MERCELIRKNSTWRSLLPQAKRYVEFLGLSSREKDETMANWKIPFGRAKDELITETDPANLRWVIDALQKKLDEDPKKPYADKDKAWIAAAKAELIRRDNGGERQQKPAPQAIQRVPPPASLGIGINDPVAVTGLLQKLTESYHIVSPATSVDVLPPGCGVATSYLVVDKNPKNKEVFDLSGMLGLSGVTLNRIAAIAGIDWDSSKSGRLDNGSDPHYAHFRAVGYVRNFDGTKREIPGEVEIDARDGSPQIKEIQQKAAKRAKKDGKANDGGELQILELRKFLLRHAESKARNRATANGLGIKRAYNPEELDKPFAVCRLMWTGETQDPELKRLFAEKTADIMLGGMAALYGRPAPLPAPAPHVPAALPRFEPNSAPQFKGHSPPPLASGPAPVEIDDFDDYDFGGGADDDGPTREPQRQNQPAATSAPVPQRGSTGGNAPMNSAGATAATAQTKPKANAPAPAKTHEQQAAEDRDNGIDPRY